MKSLRCERLSLIIIVLFIPSNCIRCNHTDHDENPEEKKRDLDVISALDSLHKTLVERYVPLELRCQRYSILLSRAEIATGPFLFTTVLQLISPNRNLLDENLGLIDQRRHMSLLMAGIDRYRTDRLGPGFIDLIDCLRQIEQPVVSHYFYDEELIEIEELYRQVLTSPDIKFDLSRWKSPNFHVRFLMTLSQLFKDNIYGHQIRESERNLVPSSNVVGPSTSEEKGERNQLYQRKLEEQHRNRERDRLRKRRCRILNPELTRERDRTNKRRRREKLPEERRRQLRGAYDPAKRDPLHLTNRQRLIALQMQRRNAQQLLQEQNRGQLESSRTKQPLPDLNELPPEVESAPEPLDPAVTRQTAVASNPIDRVLLPLSTPASIFGLPLKSLPQQDQLGPQLSMANTVPPLTYFSQLLHPHAASSLLPAQHSSNQHAQDNRHRQVTSESSVGADSEPGLRQSSGTHDNTDDADAKEVK